MVPFEKHFHYLDINSGGLIRIYSIQRPGPGTKKAKAGLSWSFAEWDQHDKMWRQTAFCQIYWDTLQNLQYLGMTQVYGRHKELQIGVKK